MAVKKKVPRTRRDKFKSKEVENKPQSNGTAAGGRSKSIEETTEDCRRKRYQPYKLNLGLGHMPLRTLQAYYGQNGDLPAITADGSLEGFQYRMHPDDLHDLEPQDYDDALECEREQGRLHGTLSERLGQVDHSLQSVPEEYMCSDELVASPVSSDSHSPTDSGRMMPLARYQALPDSLNHADLQREFETARAYRIHDEDRDDMGAYGLYLAPGPDDLAEVYAPHVLDLANGPDQFFLIPDESGSSFLVPNFENPNRLYTIPEEDEETEYTEFCADRDAPTEKTDSEKDARFGWCDTFFCVLSICSYLADIGSDVWVAHMYYTRYINRNYWWFVLTVAFIVVPALIMTTFSLTLYIIDHVKLGEKASPARWVSRVLFLFLQLGPLLRAIDTLIYGCKSRTTGDDSKKDKLYTRMLDEDTDSSLLRLIETFMEAAPQLVLQLYIMSILGTSSDTFLVIGQSVGLTTSLISLGWALVMYQKALRASLEEKANLHCGGIILQFLWRICTISARVLALAMFASYFHYWVFVVAGSHWLLMFVWVCWQDTDYCGSISTSTKGNKYMELGFKVVASLIHIFCFFNLIEGHTRLRFLVFYAIMYVENVAMIVSWYVAGSTLTLHSWYHAPVMIVVTAGFPLGILIQILYYVCCHPNKFSEQHRKQQIRLCVPCAQLSLFQDLAADSDSGMRSLETYEPVGHSTPLSKVPPTSAESQV